MSKLLNKWLKLVPIKYIINLELEQFITDEYNKNIKEDLIISFDIEFIKYIIKYSQIITIHEMGGLILLRNNNKWYLYCLFHLNMIPLISNINQYYLLTSNYNTLSDDTYKKVVENELKLLPENDIDHLKNNEIVKKYLSDSKIEELIANKNYKKISKIKYMIKGYDLARYNKFYKLFINNIKLILNDSEVIKRQILKEDEKQFIKLTNKLFSKSYLIIKGLEDLKALKNHTLLLNETSIKLTNYFDII